MPPDNVFNVLHGAWKTVTVAHTVEQFNLLENIESKYFATWKFRARNVRQLNELRPLKIENGFRSRCSLSFPLFLSTSRHRATDAPDMKINNFHHRKTQSTFANPPNLFIESDSRLVTCKNCLASIFGIVYMCVDWFDSSDFIFFLPLSQLSSVACILFVPVVVKRSYCLVGAVKLPMHGIRSLANRIFATCSFLVVH